MFKVYFIFLHIQIYNKMYTHFTYRTFPFAGTVTFTYGMFLKHIVPKKYQDRIDNPKDPITNLWRFSAGVFAGMYIFQFIRECRS